MPRIAPDRGISIWKKVVMFSQNISRSGMLHENKLTINDTHLSHRPTRTHTLSLSPSFFPFLPPPLLSLSLSLAPSLSQNFVYEMAAVCFVRGRTCTQYSLTVHQSWSNWNITCQAREPHKFTFCFSSDPAAYLDCCSRAIYMGMSSMGLELGSHKKQPRTRP